MEIPTKFSLITGNKGFICPSGSDSPNSNIYMLLVPNTLDNPDWLRPIYNLFSYPY